MTITQEIKKTIITVTENLKEKFIEKIEKIIKKGLKLGVEVSYQLVNEYFKEKVVWDQYIGKNKTLTVKYFDYEITGNIPYIKGYEFIAVCEFHNDHNLINQNPFVEVQIPEKFKTYRNCDHCNFKRNRKHTVILRNVETNEFISVGKSCVKDFLQCDDPHNISLFVKNFEEFNDEDFCSFGATGNYYFRVEEILAYANAVVNKFGFVSKAKSKEAGEIFQHIKSTSSRVLTNLIPNPYMSKSEQEENLVDVTDEDYEQAKIIIEWFKTNKKDFDSTNNYIYNLSVLIDDVSVHENKIGIIVSLVNMYNKEMKQIEESEKINSEWVGNIKDKVDFKVKVENIYTTEGYYGFVAIYNMVDENDNKIVWKTNDDKSYLIKGTVKDHSEWKNIKQTNISRVKIIENI